MAEKFPQGAAPQENKMGVLPIGRLLTNMAVPMMISMLVQACYNVVDSVFVAQISEDALNAVSLAFPLQNLMIAFGAGTAVGINALLSRSLGEKNQAMADRAANTGIFLALCNFALFALIGIFFSRTFFELQAGGEQVIIDYGVDYASICLGCSIGIFSQFCFERLLQSTGRTFLAMCTQLTGALINIVLDPILIFGLLGAPRMGVAGAAVATVAGQLTACTMAMIYFFRAKTGMHITRRDMKVDWNIARKIYGVGVPSCLMTAMPSLLVGVLNALLVELHELAVAVFGLYFKLQTFVYMPANGLIQGMRPIVSYNYGARQKQRMHSTIRWSLTLTAVIMALGTLIAWLLPEQIMALFDANSAMVAIGVPMLRITSLGFLVSTFGTVLAGCFEALGKGMQSLAVSLIRQLVVIPPLALVLSRFWELNGVWASFPVAETLAALAAVAFYRGMMRRIDGTME